MTCPLEFVSTQESVAFYAISHFGSELGVNTFAKIDLKTTARSYVKPTNSYARAIILVFIAEYDAVAR